MKWNKYVYFWIVPKPEILHMINEIREIPDKAELQNLYDQLVRADELNSPIEKALTLAAERDKLDLRILST